MHNYAAKRAERARRENLRSDPSDVELLPMRIKLKPAGTFAGDAARANIARQFVDDPSAVEIDPVWQAPTIDAAATRFVGWLREMGLPGVYTDREMREYVEWWRHDEVVGALPDRLLMNAVSRQLGVRRERVRLTARGEGLGRVTRYRILERIDPVVTEGLRLAA